jgi:hypothetical protein
LTEKPAGQSWPRGSSLRREAAQIPPEQALKLLRRIARRPPDRVPYPWSKYPWSKIDALIEQHNEISCTLEPYDHIRQLSAWDC